MTPVPVHVTESGSGTPVVLLHAFPLDSRMWRAQRAGLADEFRVVTPDQRGFAGSPLGSDEPSLDHVADDVAALLDALGLDRVVLGGLSMGGYAAMAFLRRHPGRVQALVLADTKAAADPPPAREKRERIAARLEAEGTTDALVEEVLPALCGPTTAGERPMVTAEVTSMVRSAAPAAAAWAQRAMAARPDSSGTLRTVAVPTLVVRGDEDELSTAADADAMVAALPDARLEVLAGSGHLSAMEVPDAFTATVRAFLAGL
jgi:pimeloyl-ACP methyl ester carboxylesterase